MGELRESDALELLCKTFPAECMYVQRFEFLQILDQSHTAKFYPQTCSVTLLFDLVQVDFWVLQVTAS